MTVVAVEQLDSELTICVDAIWFGCPTGISVEPKYVKIAEDVYVFCVGKGFTPQQEMLFESFTVLRSIAQQEMHVPEGQTLIFADLRNRKVYEVDHSEKLGCEWSPVKGPMVAFGCYDHEVTHFYAHQGETMVDAVKRVHAFWNVTKFVDVFTSSNNQIAHFQR